MEPGGPANAQGRLAKTLRRSANAPSGCANEEGRAEKKERRAPGETVRPGG